MARNAPIDTTTGPLWSRALQLAWPAVLQAFLVNFYAFNDFVFVGFLGDKDATAALSSCFAVLIINAMVIRIFPTGSTTLIAQFTGAKKVESVLRVFRQGIVASVAWATVTGVLAFHFIDAIVGLNNATPAVGAHIEDYLGVVFLAGPAFALMLLVDGVFRARGDTRTPLLLEVVSLIINTGLNWVLVLGNLGAPELGITGAAIATTISRALPGFVGLLLISRGALGFTPGRPDRSWLPRRKTLGPMGRIGFFESLGGAVYGIVYLMLNRMAGEIGPEAQGGLGAGLRGIEWIAFAFADGFLVSAVTIVGQNLGAGRADRAWRGAWMTAGLSMVVTQLVGTAFIIWPGPLSAMVTDDALTLAYATEYVSLMGYFMWAVGFEMAVYGAFVGAGRTEITFLVSGLANLVRVPIAALLLFGDAWLPGTLWAALGLGDAPTLIGPFIAIGWTIGITAVLKCFAYAAYFAIARPGR